jgi:hypothetical protein
MNMKISNWKMKRMTLMKMKMEKPILITIMKKKKMKASNSEAR